MSPSRSQAYLREHMLTPEKYHPFRDSLDATMNFSAHVKFVTKWLEKLVAEEKQASAPPPTEPGLITESALATEPDPESEPGAAGTAPALRLPTENMPEDA